MPLLERLMDVIASNLKHVLGVLTTSFLEAPGRRIAEVEAAGPGTIVVLLEVVSDINAGIGSFLPIESISTAIVVVDAVRGPEVRVGVL